MGFDEVFTVTGVRVLSGVISTRRETHDTIESDSTSTRTFFDGTRKEAARRRAVMIPPSLAKSPSRNE